MRYLGKELFHEMERVTRYLEGIYRFMVGSIMKKQRKKIRKASKRGLKGPEESKGGLKRYLVQVV